MSTFSSNTVITEIPAVTNAAKRLHELSARMKSDEFGFHENDVENIDRIIESLNELESERAKMHENLEVETIEASILRHRLQFLPSEIKQEISAAVNSARQSNAAELTRLQEKLDSINSNILQLEKKHEELEKENSVLHPERDMVREGHDEIIMLLNQKLAEKAGKQIALNETRDKLRETNQKIVDIEENIVQLKEDLIQERADARMEKKRLKKAVYDTTLKTREQKEANVVKKKEVDELRETVFESETELDNIRKNVRQFETSKSRLEGQERALTAQYNKEIKQNQELKEKGLEITQQIIREEEAFEKKRGVLESRIEELDVLMEEAKVINTDLTARKKQSVEDLNEKIAIRKQDEIRVKQFNYKLQNAKIDLGNKAEEVGRLTQENVNMEEHMIGLEETHKSIIETLTRQIDEARMVLAKERTERMDLQSDRDTVQKEIENFKAEVNKYMAEMIKAINSGKVEHDRLSVEGIHLQKSVREDDEIIKQLDQDLTNSQKAFAEEKNILKAENEKLESEIVQFEKKLKEKEEELEERKPNFVALEEGFKEQTEEYNKMKKNIVIMKNQKMGLEDSVKRSKREIDKLVKPKNEFQKKVHLKREEILEQLHQQASDVKDIETKIYTFGVKLKRVLEENDRFSQANHNLDKDILSFNYEIGENDNVLRGLQQQLDGLKENLGKDWAEDNKMQEEFAFRDKELVKELGMVLDRTGQRESIISGITCKLEEELHLLAQFLDNVANQRPIGQGKELLQTQLSAPTTSRYPLPPITARSENTIKVQNMPQPNSTGKL